MTHRRDPELHYRSPSVVAAFIKQVIYTQNRSVLHIGAKGEISSLNDRVQSHLPLLVENDRMSVRGVNSSVDIEEPPEKRDTLSGAARWLDAGCIDSRVLAVYSHVEKQALQAAETGDGRNPNAPSQPSSSSGGKATSSSGAEISAEEKARREAKAAARLARLKRP